MLRQFVLMSSEEGPVLAGGPTLGGLDIPLDRVSLDGWLQVLDRCQVLLKGSHALPAGRELPQDGGLVVLPDGVGRGGLEQSRGADAEVGQRLPLSDRRRDGLHLGSLSLVVGYHWLAVS